MQLIHPKPFKFVLLTALLAFANTAANAQLVEAKWADGAFAHQATIAPKTFLEVCGKLKTGEAVAWRFDAATPTDFNIHYHVGKDVVYPENRKDVAAAEGILTIALDQGYCWMWSNRTANPVEINVNLKHLPISK